MKTIGVLIFLGLTFVSCDKKNQGTDSENPESKPIENQLSLKANQLFVIDSSEYLFIPLTMSEIISRDEYGSSYKNIPYYNHWNVLFHNTKTKEQSLLTNQKILITDFFFERDEPEHLAKDFIFYSIYVDDRNNDKLLNSEDPLYIFLSDKKGKGFKQISPTGCDVIAWRYVKESNTVFLNAKKDSNENKIFDDEDEISVFEINLSMDKVPKELLSPELKIDLKRLFGTHWKKPKK